MEQEELMSTEEVKIEMEFGPTNVETIVPHDYVPKFPDILQRLVQELRDEIKSLKTEICDMKKEIKELKDENKQAFNKLTKEVIAVKLENRKHHNDITSIDEFKDLQKLPLTRMDDLEKLDEDLQNNEDDLRQFKELIAKLGGDGHAQFLRSAVRKVFSDELASAYSWKGTSTKPSAEKCFVITAIKNICNLKYKCTDKDMNTVLQQHFVHAKDRIAKRKLPIEFVSL